MEAPREFDLDKTLREILSDGREVPCIFDRLLYQFENFSERPVSTIGDIKRRDNKRAKGLGWEKFCQFYLSRVLQYHYVWLWNEIPDNIRAHLKLVSRVDNGIDIVCAKVYANDSVIFTAVQCKYRKRIDQTVTWTTLSTFIGLCAVTGPWNEHIVMTNCKGVSRRTGVPKGPKDKTIAYGTFKNLSREQCSRSALGEVSQYQKLNTDQNPVKIEKPRTLEELRAARLAKFSDK